MQTSKPTNMPSNQKPGAKQRETQTDTPTNTQTRIDADTYGDTTTHPGIDADPDIGADIDRPPGQAITCSPISQSTTLKKTGSQTRTQSNIQTYMQTSRQLHPAERNHIVKSNGVTFDFILCSVFMWTRKANHVAGRSRA